MFYYHCMCSTIMYVTTVTKTCENDSHKNELVVCMYLFFAGVISLSRSLHGKANTVISMVISAEDGGGLTAPVNARVNVSVVGGSVASPVFEQAQYFFTVSEDVLRGTAVGVVRASAKTGEAIVRSHALLDSWVCFGYFRLAFNTCILP